MKQQIRVGIMRTTHSTASLQQKMADKRAMRLLCSEAVDQQVKRGEATSGQLRNRRRYLVKQVLKRVPLSAQRSPRKLLHVASMVLAMWGFVGLSVPQVAEATPIFQHNMLDGFDVGSNATPTFADIDGDGDLDAFVGNNLGTVKFYRNNGTNRAPAFVADVAGNPLAGVAVRRSAAPTFADIDGDGDLDAFVGERFGTGNLYRTVRFYRNNGTNRAPAFVADAAGNPLAGFAVGSYATPTFADIDGDGDLDVFVGHLRGSVRFYRNNGTNLAPAFVADAAGNPLAGVFVRRFATPTFADIDGDGDLDAFVGDIYGIVKFYRNNGTNLAPAFVADIAGNPLAGFDVGSNATPTFADIDGDGDLDAFVGESTGTVNFYRNNGRNLAPVFAADVGVAVGSRAAPTFADIDGDGDLDVFVGERLGTVKFYRNNGTNLAPAFAADIAGNRLAGFDVGSYSKPTFADIDGDGDLDAFVGEGYGRVKFYRNHGTNLVPVFAADVLGNPLAGVAVGRRAAPTFADIDGDGDLDAFVGEINGTVRFYRNNGTNLAPALVADGANPLAGVAAGSVAMPTFADIDGDGDLDAFVGEINGTVRFYRNNGTNLAPAFVADIAGNPLAGFGVGSRATPTFADIDGDGDLDAFVGNDWGTVKFFKNLDPSPTTVADTLNAFVNTASTTGDVTRNDVFKLGSSVVTFPIIAFDSASVQGGIVTYNGNNTFTYLPAVGFSGTDSFTYTLSDGAGNSAVGTVNVTVTGTVTVPPFASGTTTGGGVGCVISPSQSFDPLLPLLIIAGLFMPWIRRNMLKSMETDTNTTT